jgi:hypothetical protein
MGSSNAHQASGFIDLSQWNASNAATSRETGLTLPANGILTGLMEPSAAPPPYSEA